MANIVRNRWPWGWQRAQEVDGAVGRPALRGAFGRRDFEQRGEIVAAALPCERRQLAPDAAEDGA